VRKVVTIQFGGTETLIIASDNSGAIGMKKGDSISVPYDTTAYYSFRVAAMECIAAGGEPLSVVLSNFCGDEAWKELERGIQRGIDELHLEHVLITGSTESNFLLQQSAIGIMVLGRKLHGKNEDISFNDESKIAIIGKPLVGNEVIGQDDQIAPLPLFQKTCRLEGITVWPVGSKGVLSELNRMCKNQTFFKDQVITDVDVTKSSGPATCFIVLYEENAEAELKKLTGSYFHPVTIMS
jgi:hypothetical protein